MQPLDGPSIDLANEHAPRGCDVHTAQRALALFCLASAEVAARLADEADLGAGLTAGERRDWQSVISTLLDFAHHASPEAGERGEPGPLHVDFLGAVLKAGRRR